MQRAFLCAVLLFGFISLAGSQEASGETAALFTYWSEDDSFLYSYEKARTDTKDGMETTTRVTSKIRVKVEKETSDYYIIKWNYFDYSDSNFIKYEPAVIEVLKKLYEIEYVFKINESGAFLELLNTEQIRIMIEKTFEMFFDLYEHDTRILSVLESFKAIFLTNTDALKLVLKDIVFIHSCYAKSYVLDNLVEFSTSLNSPLFAESVQATGNLLATYSDGNLSIKQVISVSKDEVIRFVKSIMDTYSSADPDFSAITKAEYKYTTSVDFDYDTGWFQSYTSETIGNFVVQKRVDLTVIKIIK